MYQQLIRETLARTGHVGAADPRHVEAFMRVEHPTLDGLAPQQFEAETLTALACVQQSSAESAELLARSLGL